MKSDRGGDAADFRILRDRSSRLRLDVKRKESDVVFLLCGGQETRAQQRLPLESRSREFTAGCNRQ